MTDTIIPEELNNMAEFHELQAVKKSNVDKLQHLQSMQMQIEPYGMLMSRLELLVQSIFTTEQRIVFELRYEKMLSDQLDQALSEAAQQTLLQGVPLGESANQFLVP